MSPGVEPAVADRGRRRVGVAVVAEHHRVAADDDLPDLLAVGADVVAGRVHDPHRHARDRPAGHRPALDRALRAAPSAVRTSRGRAIVTIGVVSESP